MWGGLGLMFFFSRLSVIRKQRRRDKYVKQIRKRHFHFKFGHHSIINSRNHSDEEEQPTCSICLCEFEEKDVIKKLRCGHYFHSECIDPWLLNNKAVCPVCRRGIYDNDEWVGEPSSDDL